MRYCAGQRRDSPYGLLRKLCNLAADLRPSTPNEDSRGNKGIDRPAPRAVLQAAGLVLGRDSYSFALPTIGEQINARALRLQVISIRGVAGHGLASEIVDIAQPLHRHRFPQSGGPREILARER